MTKDDVLALMRDAGLENPRVIPHTSAERKFYFDLLAGPDEARRSARALRSASKSDIKEAIAKLNA